MEDIYYEKVLNRIIQGRLRIRLGDLVLFVHEPDKDILEESYEIYEQAYQKAYFSGVYIRDEVLQLLVENDLWTPLDDKQADDLEEKIDDLKVEAFQSFVHKRKLAGIKRQIRNFEKQILQLRYKKHQLDHVTCEGVASFTKKCWITENTTKFKNGELFGFKGISVSAFLDIVGEHQISTADYKKIARSSPFRQMWLASKKSGALYGKESSDLDVHQLALISFSQMYDNVFESPESPDEKIIEDDDCLDGWFVLQHRKYKQEKKQAEIDNMITNKKIANSDEIFVMTTPEDAKNIYDLNNPMARNAIKAREKQISQHEGNLHFSKLDDVQQSIGMQRTNEGLAAMKSKSRGS